MAIRVSLPVICSRWLDNKYESGLTYFCQEANQIAPSEPNEKNTEGQLNLCIRPGENANPVTEPKYIPLYTKASDLLRSRTGTQRDSKLFIAGIATPYNQRPLQGEFLIFITNSILLEYVNRLSIHLSYLSPQD